MTADAGEGGEADVFPDLPADSPPALDDSQTTLWESFFGPGSCTGCACKGDVAAEDGESPVAQVMDDEGFAETAGEFVSEADMIQRTTSRRNRAHVSAGLFGSITQRTSRMATGIFKSLTGNSQQAETEGGAAAETQIAPEANAVPTPTAPFVEQQNVKLLCNVNKAVRNLQKSVVAKESGPSDVEIARGVQVELIYEFYDPVTRKTRLRKMNDDVLHRRRGMGPKDKEESDAMHTAASAGDIEVAGDEELAAMLSPRSGASSSSNTMMETESDDSASRSPKGAASKGMLKRSFTTSNTEVVVKWGAVVGKVLHAKVLDFAALKNKAMRQQRLQVGSNSAASSNRMVARMQNRARIVVKQAKSLAKKLSREPDCFDSEWNDPSLLSYLFSTEYLDTLMLVTNVACKLLQTQPPMAVAKAPCKIFGDIHGQLRDFLLILFAFGAPNEEDDMHWVFNGDFVDRGAHQLEVVGILLSLKVLYPDRVWLVRGNHEDRSMNERYGFMDACTKLLGNDFGHKVFELVQGCFDRLPVACLVQDKILCVHGGIGDGTWKLDDLRTIPRPLGGDAITHPSNSWIFNILWSDPIEDGKDADPHVFGVHESPRGGVAAQFAWDITKTFCARNGLSLIVRSHQSKKGSRGFDVMHENMLVRVFSARDYEGHGNDGAVLKVTAKEEDGNTMLVVRPQVVRSMKKTNEEEKRRRGSDGSPPGSPPGGGSPRSPRAGNRANRTRALRSPPRSPVDGESSARVRRPSVVG